MCYLIILLVNKFPFPSRIIVLCIWEKFWVFHEYNFFKKKTICNVHTYSGIAKKSNSPEKIKCIEINDDFICRI